MSIYKQDYNTRIVPLMQKEFDLSNIFEVPKIKKVVVSSGTGKHFRDAKKFEKIKNALTVLTGQTPVSTKAKQSISQFKSRQGMTVGLKVTLRGERMYDFLERLVTISLPRTRDFQGISLNSVDKIGNLNFGIPEQTIFAELSNEDLEVLFGLQVSIQVANSDKSKTIYLLKELGFPLRVKNNKV
jgi:large subunit ribosomal protein L5